MKITLFFCFQRRSLMVNDWSAGIISTNRQMVEFQLETLQEEKRPTSFILLTTNCELIVENQNFMVTNPLKFAFLKSTPYHG